MQWSGLRHERAMTRHESIMNGSFAPSSPKNAVRKWIKLTAYINCVFALIFSFYNMFCMLSAVTSVPQRIQCFKRESSPYYFVHLKNRSFFSLALVPCTGAYWLCITAACFSIGISTPLLPLYLCTMISITLHAGLHVLASVFLAKQYLYWRSWRRTREGCAVYLTSALSLFPPTDGCTSTYSSVPKYPCTISLALLPWWSTTS